MKKTGNDAVERAAERAVRKAGRKRMRKRCVALLSAFILLFTMNLVKLPADTLERIATCGLAEHAHTDACYDDAGDLTCGLAEHVHTDACYQTRPLKGKDDGEGTALGYSDAHAKSAEPALIGDGDFDAPVEEVILTSAYEDQPLRYEVGETSPIYLEDILEAVELAIDVDDRTEAGQVVDDEHPEGTIRVVSDEKGVAIYPLRGIRQRGTGDHYGLRHPCHRTGEVGGTGAER